MLRRAWVAGARRAQARRFAEVASAYKTVPFKKEDMTAVMAEVPEFEYYHIGSEGGANPFKDVNMSQSVLPEGFAQTVGDGAYSFSKLENGLKVVSVDNGGPTSEIGLYVKAGSRWESAAEWGASHMLELCAFKSTAHLSHLRTVKTLETLGVDAKCTAGREHMAYTASMMREYVPVAVPLLIGNVLFPRLLPWEVNAAHELVSTASMMSMDASVTETLLQTAYHTNSLGHPLQASELHMANFNPETLRQYMIKHFSPDRMVMVGVNVSHDVLATWCMRSFVDYNAIPNAKREEAKAKYTGGSTSVPATSSNLHLAVGFEVGGLASKDLYAVTVLQALLGSVTGKAGPGSGMHTRMANIVAKGVDSASAFYQPFSDSGLLGIYVSAAPGMGASLPAMLKEELAGVQKLTAAELERAKAQAATALGAALEEPATLAEDMATQVLQTDKCLSAAEMSAAIAKVTEADVKGVAKAMLATNPTLVAYGDVTNAPLYADVQALFKK